MVPGFLKAIYLLTAARPSLASYSPVKHQYWFLVSFPLVGLLLGIPAMGLAGWVHTSLPVLCAWLIPVIWLALSGGKSFVGFCTTISSLSLLPGTEEQNDSHRRSDNSSLLAAICTVVVLGGKSFALLQSELLDTRTFCLAVLLIPVISRYLALMSALDNTNSTETFAEARLDRKALAASGASLITLIILSFSLALGLILLIFGLFSAVIVRIIVCKRDGTFPPYALGAVIEISETTMCWVPVIFASLGLNLSLFRILS